MKTTYIVSAHRTAVGKALRGLFRFKRPDELAAETIEHMMNTLPDFDVTTIDDVLIGNAMPEAEQGLNMARLISCLLYTSPSPRDRQKSRMPSSA